MTMLNNQKYKKLNPAETDDYLLPHIIFNSCHEVLVEGSKGVLEYSADKIRLNAGIYILVFSGADLCIRNMSMQEVVIIGDIVSFEFCQI